MTGPRFCWHCGMKLESVYAEVSDQIGNVHRVHKCCLPSAKLSVSCLTVDIIEIPPQYDNRNHDKGEWNE